MLFAKEIYQGKIKNNCNDKRNDHRCIIYTSVFLYQELVNEVIDYKNNYYCYNSLSFIHGGELKLQNVWEERYVTG